MREILFRGKAINREAGEHRTDYKNGEWVYGLYTKVHRSIEGLRTFEIPAEMSDGYASGIDVDYKTIGQYIGKKDKNGNKIFEGDILKLDRLGYDTVGVVTYDEDNAEFDVDIKNCIIDQVACYQSHEIEIVGNIHDNPKLVNEGD